MKQIDTNPPLIHNLLRLAEKSGLTVCEEQEDGLDTISTFNIRARYDDYKSEFYQLCTQKFMTQWMTHIKELRTWIKQKLSK